MIPQEQKFCRPDFGLPLVVYEATMAYKGRANKTKSTQKRNHANKKKRKQKRNHANKTRNGSEKQNGSK